MLAERVENARSRVGIRTVVERERHVVGTRREMREHGPEHAAVSMKCAVDAAGNGETPTAPAWKITPSPRRSRARRCTRRAPRVVTLGQPYFMRVRRRRSRRVAREAPRHRAAGPDHRRARPRSPHGNINASRSCSTTSRNPRMSEQTTGVSHAIDSSSVIPNDAFVVGHA